MSNLFITYDINNNEQDFDLLKKTINSLGNMTQLNANCWYVNSMVSAEEALKRVGSVMLKESSLVVIDAENNSCVWLGLDEKLAQRIRQNWHMDLTPKNPKTADKNADNIAESAKQEATH